MRVIVLSMAVGAACVADQDDFESYATGAFPFPFWNDGALLHPPEPNPPVPSAVVVETTDAFGAPTQALGYVDAIGETQGIYHGVTPADRYVVRVDARVDQYADNPQFDTSDWPVQFGVAQYSVEGDLCCVPQVGLFVSSLSQTWQLFAVGDELGGLITDFEVPAVIGTWYTAEIDFTVSTGVIRSRIWDTFSGELLLDRTDLLEKWTPDDGPFDMIVSFDGDLSIENTIANLAVVDNFEFQLGEPACIADCNGDGELNILDFVCFQAMFLKGCP